MKDSKYEVGFPIISILIKFELTIIFASTLAKSRDEIPNFNYVSQIIATLQQPLVHP